MDQTNKFLIQFWVKKVLAYARANGYKIDPIPTLNLIDGTTQKNSIDNLLIQTGYYTPSNSQITLFIDNRHLKDILRSYCHELIHHMQNIENSDYIRRIYSQNIIDSPELEEIEGEAYFKGNILFRSFTESLKKKIQKEKL